MVINDVMVLEAHSFSFLSRQLVLADPKHTRTLRYLFSLIGNVKNALYRDMVHGSVMQSQVINQSLIALQGVPKTYSNISINTNNQRTFLGHSQDSRSLN